MAFKDLQSFLHALDERGLLSKVDVEVDPDLEITEITDRISKLYGKGLQFNRVKGSKYPLVINTMGTYERLNLGFGVNNLDDIAEEMASFMDFSQFSTLMGKLKAIPKFMPLLSVFPKKVTKAPCQEVIEEPDLDTLPILKCWPQDGGKYITLPLVFTVDPENGQQNVGMYRLQVYDKKTTGMHWHLHKDGREIYEKYRKLGKKMPVSVALGCDPITIYSATAPMPKMIDEMLLAGYLKKQPVELVKSVTNDIYVPANAEFILEGYVDLDELREEGPFGDHTGYYSLSDMYPVFHLEKITHKTNAVYPTTIVGQPPMEDCYLGKATERITLPLLKIIVPEVVDMDFPLEGVFHNCVIVSIKKAFIRHAQKTLYGLWGMGQMMYTKMIIIVDEDVNVHDYQEVVETINRHANVKNDWIITEGPLDALDHAGEKGFQGYRIGIDATKKWAGESVSSFPYGTATAPQLDEQTKNSLEALKTINPGVIQWSCPVDSLGASAIVFAIDKKQSNVKVRQFLEEQAYNAFPQAKYVVVVDKGVDPDKAGFVAWKIFNNMDPNRDFVFKNRQNGAIYIGIDATRKGPDDGHTRPWPDDIEMSEEIKQLVDARWESYKLD